MFNRKLMADSIFAMIVCFAASFTLTTGCKGVTQTQVKTAVVNGLSDADEACIFAKLFLPSVTEIADACKIESSLAPAVQAVIDEFARKAQNAVRLASYAHDAGADSSTDAAK